MPTNEGRSESSQLRYASGSQRGERGRLFATIPEEERKKLSEIARRKGISLNKCITEVIDGLEVPGEEQAEPVETSLRFCRVRCDELVSILAERLDAQTGQVADEDKADNELLAAQIEDCLFEEQGLRAEVAGLLVEKIPVRKVTVGTKANKMTFPLGAGSKANAGGDNSGRVEEKQTGNQQRRRIRFI